MRLRGNPEKDYGKWRAKLVISHPTIEGKHTIYSPYFKFLETKTEEEEISIASEAQQDSDTVVLDDMESYVDTPDIAVSDDFEEID